MDPAVGFERQPVESFDTSRLRRAARGEYRAMERVLDRNDDRRS